MCGIFLSFSIEICLWTVHVNFSPTSYVVYIRMCVYFACRYIRYIRYIRTLQSAYTLPFSADFFRLDPKSFTDSQVIKSLNNIECYFIDQFSSFFPIDLRQKNLYYLPLFLGLKGNTQDAVVNRNNNIY